MTNFIIRPESPSDAAGIYRVHAAAFPSDAEAKLVDALRHAGRLAVSLVAELGGEIVGHIAFSPVRIAGAETHPPAVGLAPVAALPPFQNRGIGAKLITDGIAACRAGGHGFVVVLGEPAYYRRFGFETAGRFHLGNEYGADEAFMALELQPHTIPAAGGLVQYAPEFAALE